eukprot:TRINITY_DN1568_c1_g3_i5.p1 TRINITY_DN1568_c1_g3~~TRINITY_DN1568_c1_g3_i5.p1  ORF type:complete len:448 (-),score=95.21 TRINITY_DN1568_c1_g3_i5:510-1811(-)
MCMCVFACGCGCACLGSADFGNSLAYGRSLPTDVADGQTVFTIVQGADDDETPPGTSPWCAPEAAANVALTTASELYSFGRIVNDIVCDLDLSSQALGSDSVLYELLELSRSMASSSPADRPTLETLEELTLPLIHEVGWLPPHASSWAAGTERRQVLDKAADVIDKIVLQLGMACTETRSSSSSSSSSSSAPSSSSSSSRPADSIDAPNQPPELIDDRQPSDTHLTPRVRERVNGFGRVTIQSAQTPLAAYRTKRKTPAGEHLKSKFDVYCLAPFRGNKNQVDFAIRTLYEFYGKPFDQGGMFVRPEDARPELLGVLSRLAHALLAAVDASGSYESICGTSLRELIETRDESGLDAQFNTQACVEVVRLFLARHGFLDADRLLSACQVRSISQQVFCVFVFLFVFLCKPEINHFFFVRLPFTRPLQAKQAGV